MTTKPFIITGEDKRDGMNCRINGGNSMTTSTYKGYNGITVKLTDATHETERARNAMLDELGSVAKLRNRVMHANNARNVLDKEDAAWLKSKGIKVRAPVKEDD